MNSNPSQLALGIDLGGSSVKSIWIDSLGNILSRETTAFEATNAMEWADKIRELLAHPPGGMESLRARVGLSAPGLAAGNALSIRSMPGRLQGLEGLNWTAFLKRDAAVPVLNDAQAALLGECWLGAGRGFTNVLLITLGTGVGGAAMVDGRILKGHLGRAGHLGHTCLDIDAPPDVCGAPGSLEQMIGNCTILDRSGGRFRTTHELIEAFKVGDPFAAAIWLRSLKGLSAAIASFINILDPERVIIGGGIARADALLFEPLRDFLDPMEWRPTGSKVDLVPAVLGEYAGAVGAARAALNSNLG